MGGRQPYGQGPMGGMGGGQMNGRMGWQRGGNMPGPFMPGMGGPGMGMGMAGMGIGGPVGPPMPFMPPGVGMQGVSILRYPCSFTSRHENTAKKAEVPLLSAVAILSICI